MFLTINRFYKKMRSPNPSKQNFHYTHYFTIFRWKQWKLLTGDPGGPDGHIFPPELNNESTKLKFSKKSKKVLEDATFIATKRSKRVVLFDIDADPLELIDLSGKFK